MYGRGHVVFKTVAVVSKQWAVSSVMPMLSVRCSCWPVAADVGSGN